MRKISCSKSSRSMEFLKKVRSTSSARVQWNYAWKKACGFGVATDLYRQTKKKRRRFRQKTSIQSMSVFHGSKLDFDQIFTLLHEWLNYSEVNQMALEASVSLRTATQWNAFFFEVAINWCIANSTSIGGAKRTLEIDESKFGRRKYNRGHRIDGQWVFGGVERETGDFFLVPVEKRDKETLLPIIKKFIKAKTTIHSDCWKPYNELSNMGYVHQKVNHSQFFKDPQTGSCTNMIEGLWRHAKHRIPEYRRSKNDYTGYLSKYMFITRTRRQNKQLLPEFFKHCATVYAEFKFNFNGIAINKYRNDFNLEAEA